jgi:hypothetical protein
MARTYVLNEIIIVQVHKTLYCVFVSEGSRVSSGSIVSDYGLDDRAIGVLSPAVAKDFSSILCVQTGSGAHPASCTMGTGVNSGRDVMLTTHPLLVPKSRMSKKAVPLHAMEALGGRGGIAPTHSRPQH